MDLRVLVILVTASNVRETPSTPPEGVVAALASGVTREPPAWRRSARSGVPEQS